MLQNPPHIASQHTQLRRKNDVSLHAGTDRIQFLDWICKSSVVTRHSSLSSLFGQILLPPREVTPYQAPDPNYSLDSSHEFL